LELSTTAGGTLLALSERSIPYTQADRPSSAKYHPFPAEEGEIRTRGSGKVGPFWTILPGADAGGVGLTEYSTWLTDFKGRKYYVLVDI
jgi:hypothetical protein